jgi:hypothetical protein
MFVPSSGCYVFTFLPKTLKIGQTNVPETLVIHQETTPCNNPEDFKQYYDHGGSLQLHITAGYLI